MAAFIPFFSCLLISISFFTIYTLLAKYRMEIISKKRKICRKTVDYISQVFF